MSVPSLIITLAQGGIFWKHISDAKAQIAPKVNRACYPERHTILEKGSFSLLLRDDIQVLLE